jgi:peroxiredoxin
MRFFSLIIFLLLCLITQTQAQVIDDFVLDNLQNEQVSLESLKGEQLTIIDFWATWCKPCTKAMPKLNELYHQFKQAGLSVIGISCDGPRSISQIAAVANSLGIDYPILKDVNCEVMNDNQYQVFPTLIMLNSDNEVIYIHEGFSPGDEREIRERIELGLK